MASVTEELGLTELTWQPQRITYRPIFNSFCRPKQLCGVNALTLSSHWCPLTYGFPLYWSFCAWISYNFDRSLQFVRNQTNIYRHNVCIYIGPYILYIYVYNIQENTLTLQEICRNEVRSVANRVRLMGRRTGGRWDDKKIDEVDEERWLL